MPTTVSDLIGYWQDTAAAEHEIHRDDAPIIATTPHRLPEGRAPEPWFGNPAKASVFHLTLNPGHKPGSNDPTWRSFCFKMLAGRGTFEGYRRAAPADAIGWSQTVMGAFLPQCFDAICNLRLLAYPSPQKSDVAALLRRPERVPSSKLMLDFVHKTLVPRARAGDIMVLVMRSTEDWGFGRSDADAWDGGLFVSKFGLRNASISPTSRVGQRIFDFLNARSGTIKSEGRR